MIPTLSLMCLFGGKRRIWTRLLATQPHYTAIQSRRQCSQPTPQAFPINLRRGVHSPRWLITYSAARPNRRQSRFNPDCIG
ncbi:hypothetical protein DL95DRAFT_389178, partial [Leptodontidium sp. 2 PMI_412]